MIKKEIDNHDKFKSCVVKGLSYTVGYVTTQDTSRVGLVYRY